MRGQRSITIIGYGSQGCAWAHNLRDRGYEVNLVLPDSSRSHARALTDGFITTALSDSLPQSHLYALLIPDEHQSSFLQNYQQQLPAGATLLFADGYSVVFDQPKLRSDIDVLLLAPRCIGPKLRESHRRDLPVTFVLAVWQNVSGQVWRQLAKLAHDLGGTKSKLLHSTFKECAVANLFSEQVLLCGGLPGLAAETCQQMIERGIHPQLAIVSCFHELKLMTEMIAEFGVDGMFKRISPIARLGGARARRFLFDQGFIKKMHKLYDDIEDGSFDLFVKSQLGTNAQTKDASL